MRTRPLNSGLQCGAQSHSFRRCSVRCRAAFYVMTGVALIAVAVCWAFMPETKFTGSKPEGVRAADRMRPASCLRCGKRRLIELMNEKDRTRNLHSTFARGHIEAQF